MTEFILSLAVIPLAVFALITILNTFTFPRLTLRKGGKEKEKNRISVLIPMRNEAAIIARTVKTILYQEYSNLEIILLDDNSTDDCGNIALLAANGDPRLKIITGKTLPTGWLGKSWACQQLSQLASGEILLFADADVCWQPGAISALAAEMETTQADLLTAWPKQETVTWGERLVIPLMGFSIMAYLPALAVHYIPWPVFAAAIGQCLMFRKTAYNEIGGHTVVKTSIADDMAFAYKAKSLGLRFRMVDSAGLLTCRMYHNWEEVRNGYAKNILAGHGNSLFFLMISTLFHWWVFVLPWVWMVFTVLNKQLLIAAPLLLITLGILPRALSAAITKQRLTDAILMPISIVLMTFIAFQGIRWHFFGGSQWKGRALK